MVGFGGPTGVYGDGTVAGDSRHSGATTGVYGEGVLIGLHGVSLAQDASGVGLRVDGRSVFRTVGVATVPSGVKSVTVTLAGVTATDMVLATVQQTGAFYVKNAVAGS